MQAAESSRHGRIRLIITLSSIATVVQAEVRALLPALQTRAAAR